MTVKILVLLHLIGIFLIVLNGVTALGQMAGTNTQQVAIGCGVGAVLYAFSYYGLRGQK